MLVKIMKMTLAVFSEAVACPVLSVPEILTVHVTMNASVPNSLPVRPL